MTKLRLAEEEDIPELLEMGRAHVAASNYAPMGFDDQKAGAFMRKLLVGAFAAVAVSDDGRIVGAIFGDVVEPWYSTHRMGVEHVIYVRPECRGGRAAWMLVQAWVKWCWAEGAMQIRPGVSTGSDDAGAFYERLGFKRAGALYVMDGEPG